MNAKRKGTRNERRSRDLLEAEGYHVTRAGGSLGEWDLIGVRKSGFALVQVKTDRCPGSLELRVLQEFACPDNCAKLLHIWRPRCHLPDVIEL